MDIKLEEFNNCPGAEAAANYIRKYNLDGAFEVADAPSLDYYKNDSATLVLRHIPGVSLSFFEGVRLGQMQHALGADEFHWKSEDYITYYRLWWD